MLKPEETNALVKLLAQSLASEENVGHEQSRMKMYAGHLPSPPFAGRGRGAL